ncbi:MAG: SPOR domain-containing protein [Candidatus Acidiferrales bacterium]
MQLRVEVHGLGPQGTVQENAYTVNVSRSGARLTGSRYSQHPGDTVELRRGKDKAHYQVIWVGEPGTPVHGQLGLRNLEPAKNIWSAPLPPPPKPISDMPATTAEPSFSAVAESPYAADASGQSVYTSDPFTQTDEPALAAPAEEQGDTVRYGPELTPEQYLVAHAPPPLHRRPILYVGLVVALAAGLGLGWLRSRRAADETSSAAASAEASAPAAATQSLPATPTQTEPAAPPPAQAQPAPLKSGPAPVQTQPAAKPAPKKEPAPTTSGSGPVETASRTQPAPTKSGRASASTAASAFAVQVGAYGSAATAQALAKSLASRYDRKGIVDAVETRGRTLHRVRLLTPSEADARALVARIRREQNLDAIVVRPD